MNKSGSHIIYKTSNFSVMAVPQPLVCREDGGHIEITPHKRVVDRTMLTSDLAIELMYLTMLIGEAMTLGMNNRGINIGRINYQDNGNWGVFKPEGPFLHVHLYGRAKNAKHQKYGEACMFPLRETGFYDNFESLSKEDISEIRNQIDELLLTSKYSLSEWFKN